MVAAEVQEVLEVEALELGEGKEVARLEVVPEEMEELAMLWVVDLEVVQDKEEVESAMASVEQVVDLVLLQEEDLMLQAVGMVHPNRYV